MMTLVNHDIIEWWRLMRLMNDGDNYEVIYEVNEWWHWLIMTLLNVDVGLVFLLALLDFKILFHLSWNKTLIVNEWRHEEWWHEVMVIVWWSDDVQEWWCERMRTWRKWMQNLDIKLATCISKSQICKWKTETKRSIIQHPHPYLHKT